MCASVQTRRSQTVEQNRSRYADHIQRQIYHLESISIIHSIIHVCFLFYPDYLSRLTLVALR